MTIEITPYATFGPLTLGETTADECQLLFGEPLKKRTSRQRGFREFEYEEFIVRFSPETMAVRECTLLPYADAEVDGIRITWDKQFLRLACEQDESPRNSYGFIILEKMGIAVTGIHAGVRSQMAVTIYSKGDFDHFLPQSTPFIMCDGQGA